MASSSCDTRPFKELLRILHPQLAGDELGQQGVAQGGEGAGGSSKNGLKYLTF
jgi:hypothetical protein